MRTILIGLVGLGLLGVSGCGGAQESNEAARRRAEQNVRSRQLSGATGEAARNDQGRCATDDPNHEISEYDTSGDDIPDVRKVFRRAGEPPLVNLILICREADLNADGVKDVVRYYTDEGRPLREEADRNFDGGMDELIFFEEGRIIRMEQDTTGNGVVDTKIFYEEGKPVRAERDLAGRSSANSWRPDTWEYYEEGRMVRMGTDLDGDGMVDRWDRDQAWEDEQERRRAEEAARQAREAADAEEEGDGEDT